MFGFYHPLVFRHVGQSLVDQDSPSDANDSKLEEALVQEAGPAGGRLTPDPGGRSKDTVA